MKLVFSTHCNNTLHWTQMADGLFGLVSDGRRPFELVSRPPIGHLGLGSKVHPGLKWQNILKFEFDVHLIFYNLMFDSQFQLQRSVNYCN